MAINQVTLYFYPPQRQEQTITEAVPIGHPTRPASQKVFEVVRVPNSAAPVVRTANVTVWLLERGFALADWGRGEIWEFGQVRSIFGAEKEIEITVGDQNGELTDVCCRFTLLKGGHPELDSWTAFAVALSAQFGIRLGTDGTAPCGDADFRKVVQENPTWMDWARQTWNKDKSRAPSGKDIPSS